MRGPRVQLRGCAARLGNSLLTSGFGGADSSHSYAAKTAPPTNTSQPRCRQVARARLPSGPAVSRSSLRPQFPRGDKQLCRSACWWPGGRPNKRVYQSMLASRSDTGTPAKRCDPTRLRTSLHVSYSLHCNVPFAHKTGGGVELIGRCRFVAAGEPSRRVPLRPAGDPEQQSGEARTGAARWLSVRSTRQRALCVGPLGEAVCRRVGRTVAAGRSWPSGLPHASVTVVRTASLMPTGTFAEPRLSDRVSGERRSAARKLSARRRNFASGCQATLE